MLCRNIDYILSYLEYICSVSSPLREPLVYYLSHILALKEYSPEYRAVNLPVEALYPFPVFSKTLLKTVASLV